MPKTAQWPEGVTVALVDAFRKIRPDIPVILNTGISQEIDAEAADRMGIRYL